MNQCDNCTHFPICNIREDYRQLLVDIEPLQKKNPAFEVVANCFQRKESRDIQATSKGVIMDMMEYRHKAMAYLGPLPAFSTLAGEEEIYGVSSEGAPVKVCSKRLLEAVMGLNGEAGECQEIVKKAMFHGHELDIEALLLEAGDVLWYLTELCNELGISVDTIAKLNLQKLKNRYPDGFTHEASRERKE